MEIKCLALENIYDAHKIGIEQYGGSLEHYPTTESKLESILSQQFGYFGHDEYPNIYDKSAMLLYFLTKGHCFVDGNKRVGLGAMLYMFAINEYEDISEEDDWYELTYEVASSEYRQDDIKKFIKWIGELLRTKFIKG